MQCYPESFHAELINVDTRDEILSLITDGIAVPDECGDTGDITGAGCHGFLSSGLCTCSEQSVIGLNCKGTCGCCPKYEDFSCSNTISYTDETREHTPSFSTRYNRCIWSRNPVTRPLSSCSGCDNGCACGICLKLISNVSDFDPTYGECERNPEEWNTASAYVQGCDPNAPVPLDGRALVPGARCEAGGECGTSNSVDNCRNYPFSDNGQKGDCKWWQGGCSDVYEVADCYCGAPSPPPTPPVSPPPAAPCMDTGNVWPSCAVATNDGASCTCAGDGIIATNCKGYCNCCPSPPSPSPPSPPAIPAMPMSPPPVCDVYQMCQNGCECGVCLGRLSTPQCYEFRDEWWGRQQSGANCDHKTSPIENTCYSLAPLPPGEQAGTLNVTVTERYLTLTVDLDDAAVSDRIQHYTNTITAILGATFAAETRVTVKLGAKVFGNATSARRKLQVQGGGTGELGDCEEGYTSLEANIVISKPIPQPQIAAVVAALPDNVLNVGNEQVFQCSTADVAFNDDLTRIPAPPSPPTSDVITVVWTTVWALVGLFLCCFLCCIIYGILAWRRGLYDGEDKDSSIFYQGTARNNADYIIYGNERGFPFGRGAGGEDRNMGKRTLLQSDDH